MADTIQMTAKDIVNKLIADEWIAEFTYKHMAYVLKGATRDSIEREFKKISKDEYIVFFLLWE